MIHYHGTPIGGTKDNAARFLVGRHALVPFKYQNDLSAVLEFCQSFCLDNSAFSYWKNGGTMDFDAYFAWVHKFWSHPGFDFALIPDVIDGLQEDNIKFIMKWLRAGGKAKGVPVWHMHEGLDFLEWLVNEFDTIALGSSGAFSSPGTKQWWARMRSAMKVICYDDGRPKCKLHGLRMLDPEIFKNLPLTSADSTNAAVNCGSLSRFGMYTPSTSSQRAAIIADRIEQYNSSAIFVDFKQNQNDLFI
jgi:hypothetical protein